MIKKSYEGEPIETYESSSEFVYGNATEILTSEKELVTFEDYNSLYDVVGDITLNGFGSNYPIMMGNFEDSFDSWYGGDDLNLAIVFGYYDVDNAENRVILQEKIPVIVNSISTATPTPGDFAEEGTPTPISVKSLEYWMMYENAVINIENDDFKNIIISNVMVDPTGIPATLNRLGDYNIVAWSLVKRSFDHQLHEAYVCDHSEDCGGIDSPDPYGFSNQLYKFAYGYRDYLSAPFESIEDFKSQKFSLDVGDLGIDEIVTQSFMDFKEWKGDEELDLVLSMLTGSDDSDELKILLTDRIPLEAVYTTVTPSPVDFEPEEPTPTPTPLRDHDLRSWFKFSKAQLNLIDENINHLEIYDLNVIDYKKPKFLRTPQEIEIISYAIVKRGYEGTSLDAYQNSSAMVYATASVLKRELDESENLERFSDYNELSGFNGDYALEDFEVNFGIVSVTKNLLQTGEETMMSCFMYYLDTMT